MTLRERLEAVVRRYLRSDIEFRSGAREDFLSALVQVVEHEALLDTMAMPLKSQPSRKTLENILGLVGFDVRVRNTSRGSWPDLIDTVMAWAQGKPPEPTPSPADMRSVAGRYPAGDPIYWLPCRCCASCTCGYGWEQLPHAPRPAEGGRDG